MSDNQDKPTGIWSKKRTEQGPVTKSRLPKFLIWVVIVVGLFFAVGSFTQYWFSKEFLDYMKVEAAKENHNRIRDFVAESFTQCAKGSRYIVLKTNGSGGTGNISCNSRAGSFRNLFTSHFSYDGYTNPHNMSEPCCYNSDIRWPPLGRTYLGWTADNRILINTNVGTDSGGNSYLSASVTKE